MALKLVIMKIKYYGFFEHVLLIVFNYSKIKLIIRYCENTFERKFYDSK